MADISIKDPIPEEADLTVIDKRHGTFKFGKPSVDVYNRLVDQFRDDKINDRVAITAFVKSCLQEPGSDKLVAYIADFPGVLQKIGNALQELAEPEAEFIVKKG
jgi:hypothetical protein